MDSGSESSDSTDTYEESVVDFEPEVEVTSAEEEGLTLRSGQVIRPPPRPTRGVKGRRRGGREDDLIPENQGAEQMAVDIEGEESTGAVGGMPVEEEIPEQLVDDNYAVEERSRREGRKQRRHEDWRRVKEDRRKLERETERLLRARDTRDTIRRADRERNLESPVSGSSGSNEVRVRDVVDRNGKPRGEMIMEQSPIIQHARSSGAYIDYDSEVQFKEKTKKGRTKVIRDPTLSDTADTTNHGARLRRKDTTLKDQTLRVMGGNATGSPVMDRSETTEENMFAVAYPTKPNQSGTELMKTEDGIKVAKEVDEKILRLERQIRKLTAGAPATCIGGRRNRFRLAFEESDSDEWVVEEYEETPRGKLSSGRSLPEYDGSNLPLGIFLSRFRNCAKYFKWDRPSRLYYLVSVLIGAPADIVARNPNWTERDIIRELKTRYGNANRALAYQKQLEVVRQAPGQKIEDVHEEVSRLLALAFPGDKGRAVDVIGCNAFYRALANQEFSRALQTQYPIDLADALVAALALEPIYIIDQERRQEESKRTAREVNSEQELEKKLKQSQKQVSELQSWKDKTMAAAAAESKAAVSVLQPPGASAGYAAVAPQGQSSPLCDPRAPGFAPPLQFQSDAQRNSSESALGNQGQIQASSSTVTDSRVNYTSTPEYTSNYRGGRGRGRGSGRGRGTRPPFKCWNCDEPTHYAQDCPYPRRDDSGGQGGASVRHLRKGVDKRVARGNVQPARSTDLYGEDAPGSLSEDVYARVRVGGRMRKVLFDTGCSGCLVPARFVEGMTLGETDTRLYSASGQRINVLGTIKLPLVVAGVRMNVQFTVSDEIDDVMLGYEFMRDNQCEWLIGKSEMRIRGKKLKMTSIEGGSSVRRVYVREATSVPANASMLVPVRMPIAKVYAHSAPVRNVETNWLLESTSLGGGGIFTAHTLLPHADTYACVSVINLGNRGYKLTQDRRLGHASEANVLATFAENVPFMRERENENVSSVDASVVSVPCDVSPLLNAVDAGVTNDDQLVQQGVEPLVEQEFPDLPIAREVRGDHESTLDDQSQTPAPSTDLTQDEIDRLVAEIDSVCGLTDCDSTDKVKESTDRVSTIVTKDRSKVRKVNKSVSLNTGVVEHDLLVHSVGHDNEELEERTNRDGFTDTNCSGVCNYLHVELSACGTCSILRRAVKILPAEDPAGDTLVRVKVYSDSSTNTVCMDGCDCLDGLLTYCRICNSFQCKKCVTDGVGLMCYDCIEEMFEANPDLDLEAWDVVGTVRGLDYIPSVTTSEETKCRQIKCKATTCASLTDTVLWSEDTSVQTDIQYVDRGVKPACCWEHRECALNEDCVCTCVGKACAFVEHDDDFCVRCACDRNPYVPTDCDHASEPTTGDQLLAGPDTCTHTSTEEDHLALVKSDATAIASDATFSEITDESVLTAELGCESAPNWLDTDQTFVKSTRRVRAVHPRSPRIVMNSNYVDNESCSSGWTKNKRKKVSCCDSLYVVQNGGQERDGERCQQVFGTFTGETSSGFTGGDSCPAFVSKGVTACGARERDNCTDAGNGSKPDTGAVGPLGPCRVESGLLAYAQPRQPTSSARSPQGVQYGHGGAGVHRGQGKRDEPDFSDGPFSPPYFHHLQRIIDGLPTELTDREREQVVELLQNHSEVFSRSDHDLGCTHLIEARIEVPPDVKPHAEPLRRYAQCNRAQIDEEIQGLIDADVLEEADSDWNFNLVIVQKKDTGKIRVTTDFRSLNKVCRKQIYPLPRVDDCLDALAGKVWFSTMDVSQSFHQIPLAKDSRRYCAFSTRRGAYQYKRMPMGWVNSSAVFSRLMNLIFRDMCYSCVLCYLDDVIVFGNTFDEHLRNLGLVLDKFRDARIKLKPSKCDFFKRQIHFLGFNVSAEGLSLCDEGVAPIVSLKFPKTVTEMRSFLGMVNYYRQFIKGCGLIAAPLYAMTGKGVKVEATPAALEAFQQLKDALCSAPILALPLDDPNAKFMLDVDASDLGAGAVLSQYQNGVLRVVSYASKSFDRAQRGYCVTRRELAAFIFGLQTFRSYLLARDFEVRVDHRALVFLESAKEPIGQAARHLDFMSQFRYEIQYRPGEKHGNADALSRISPCDLDGGEPCKQCSKIVTGRHDKTRAVTTRGQKKIGRSESSKGANDLIATDVSQAVSGNQQKRVVKASKGNCLSLEDLKLDDDDDKPVAGRTRGRKRGVNLQRVRVPDLPKELLSWSLEYVSTCQREDADIAPAMKWVEEARLPSWITVKGTSAFTRALYRQFKSLILRNGVLYRVFETVEGLPQQYQVVLPRKLISPFLSMIHADSAAHLKFAKTLGLLQAKAWWYSYRTDLTIFIEACEKCSSFAGAGVKKQAHLRPTVIGEPCDRFSIDLTGPHVSSNGYTYLLTCIDVFSKFLIAVPLRNKTAESVVQALLKHVYLKWGTPAELLSDNGKEFCAEVNQELARVLGVQILHTTPYTPQSNGVCERVHRTLNAMFAKCIGVTQKDWSNYVDYVVFAYNCTPCSSTKLSPYLVHTTRQPRWRVDLLLHDGFYGDATVAQYTEKQVERMRLVHELVRKELCKTAEYMSEWYNRDVKVTAFEVGEKVRVLDPRHYQGRSPKWSLVYSTIGTILRCINESLYLVKLKRKVKFLHVNKLRKFIEPPTFSTPDSDITH